MSNYRAFLGDWFEDIEAESEQDAINQMAAYIVARLTHDPAHFHITAWEQPNDNAQHPRSV